MELYYNYLIFIKYNFTLSQTQINQTYHFIFITRTSLLKDCSI